MIFLPASIVRIGEIRLFSRLAADWV